MNLHQSVCPLAKPLLITIIGAGDLVRCTLLIFVERLWTAQFAAPNALESMDQWPQRSVSRVLPVRIPPLELCARRLHRECSLLRRTRRAKQKEAPLHFRKAPHYRFRRAAKTLNGRGYTHGWWRRPRTSARFYRKRCPAGTSRCVAR